MSRKRPRESEQEADVDRLRQLVDLQFDRDQIDILLAQYRSEEADAEDGASDMVCCPRQYEEDFLREPVGTERKCARGRLCEGICLTFENPFVLREFRYPGEESAETRSLCLLCRRDEISRAYYRYETGHAQSSHNLRITDHYNLVGIPGEYDVRDCIISSGKYTGLPLPVVLHVRSAYTCHVKNGVRCLAQTRMRSPDDDSSSPGPFLARRATLEKKVARSKSPQSASSS